MSAPSGVEEILITEGNYFCTAYSVFRFPTSNGLQFENAAAARVVAQGAVAISRKAQSEVERARKNKQEKEDKQQCVLWLTVLCNARRQSDGSRYTSLSSNLSTLDLTLGFALAVASARPNHRPLSVIRTLIVANRSSFNLNTYNLNI